MKKTLKVTLFRMWAAGAVCFFAAWGRGGSDEASMQGIGAAFSFNLIAGLIAIMILGDLLIVNPVIRLAGGKRAFDAAEKKPGAFLLGGFFHVIKVTALMLLIIQTYYWLNIFFITIFNMDENSVPVPLEPFLFGILYGSYYLLIDMAGKWITGKYIGWRKHEKPIYQQFDSEDERGSEDRGVIDSGLYRNDDPAPHS